MAKQLSEANAGVTRLKNDLKANTIAKCYVLFGEEDYLRRYYAAQLSQRLLDPLTEAFNCHFFNDENFSVQALSEALEALPMMAERTLLRVQDVDLFALSEADRSAVCALLSDLPEHACLLLEYTAFSPDKRKKALWDALEKNAVLAEFTYQSESDLRAWIARHFRAEKKFAAPEMCDHLLRRCGVSMTRLDGEIAKVCAFASGEEITRADIDAVVEPTLEAGVFEMTDAIAERAFDRALGKLQTMLLQRAEPIVVLAALGSQMRRLYAARVLLSERAGAQELAAVCKISPYAAKITMKQAQRLSDRFCEQAVLLCCEYDEKMKTSYDEPERLLQTLLFTLAEVARND